MFDLPEKIKKQGTAVALGYFDGIHLGHRAVLNSALRCAQKENLVPVVMLFDVHPRKIIFGKTPPVLKSEGSKRELLVKMGFTVVDFNFRESVNFSPEEFVERILIGALNARAVSCGFDFHYGKGGKGNVESLERELGKKGVRVNAQPPVLLNGQKVSSTAIRELITSGEIEKANAMLAREFSYDFTVGKGDGLGRVMGFPTINQWFPEDHVVPKYGVYASKVLVDGVRYPSVTNIGIRPTVAADNMRSETCILDFSGDLYGKNVEVCLVRYLRPEIKFSDLQALSAQIEKDIEQARIIYKEVEKDG